MLLTRLIIYSNERGSLTHALYCWFLFRKCDIQFPRDLSVAGASARHIEGICPLYRALDTSSSSLLMPTSPARACTTVIRVVYIITMYVLQCTGIHLVGNRIIEASFSQTLSIIIWLILLTLQAIQLTLCRLLSDVSILLISLLNLSNSCSNTTLVGLMFSSNFLLTTSSLNSSGSLACISEAMPLINSSLLIPDPMSAVWGCSSTSWIHISLVVRVK